MSFRDFGLLALVCLLWASNNIVSKYVIATLGVPPLFYAAVRFGVVALAVFPWLFPMPRPAWRLIVVALLMGGGNFALLFMGLQTATPSAAAVVGQVGVPMTTLLSVLMLGERIRWRRGIGIALTLAGALTVMWDPGGFALSGGLLFVVASAFAGSLGAVMMKQMEGVKPLQFQAWVGLASVAPLALLSALLEPGQVEAGLRAGWPFWVGVVYSAVVISVGAHTLYYALIQRYEANLISPLTLMTPLATIALGVALLGDPFGPRMAIGTAVALAGVLIIALRRNQVMPLLLAVWNRSQ
ncbi:permease of the drug/metabolite transporter (DMT) superfamily [Phenylobacterium zucineum HLK1]|uniref:Permease of the drug/metabolite transporter (DMT) superfamily n=1 Tax=Phenylobacterium zucineum (strain HLK1) TaxID=450851 RepID=B4RFT1_PHEZH|nr:DMT family transporter [Phenylobacterium zucineum]ACG78744.1 permease of the drug/metabolite transporter (DMT) superfamily [Phenylobacterium zucineum HLK1]